MASYTSLFGSYTPPTLSGDDEESKKQAQTATPQTAPAPAPAPAPTFSQMQAQGQARPAPPMLPPGAPMPQGGWNPSPVQPPAPRPMPQQAAPQYNGVPLQSQNVQGSPASDMDLWRQQVTQAAANPTRFDNLAFMQMRNASMDDLNAQFGNQRLSLDEELARRGLYDSTVAANQYRDLSGQQSRAMANLDAQLLKEMAQTQMSDRLASAGLAGQLAGFGENQRQFDVQQQLAQQLGLGNLDLNRQQLAQQGTQFNQSLAQNDLARQLQERLAMTELSGTYAGADGQQYNTLSRDRLAVDREVGGNDLLIRLASMLGMDGLAGLVGNRNGGGDTSGEGTGAATGDDAKYQGLTSLNDFVRRFPNADFNAQIKFAQWLTRQRNGSATPPPGTGEATQGGGPIEEQLMALLGGN